MTFSFHPSAEKELNQAVDYYNTLDTGLGNEFAREVRKSIDLIQQYPGAWSVLSKNTRHCLIKRFPFGVIYQINGDNIYIIAVMQLNREPGYWVHRID